MSKTTLHDIEAEHPEYAERKRLFRQYRDLYVGGEQFRSNAAEYLIRRQKEPLEVYGERLNRVFYENYIGSIIDWYIATLFRREPLIIADSHDPAAKRFIADFTEDCDLRGTSLTDFYRNTILDMLVCGASYILVDFPKSDHKPTNRAEEDALGTARAYINQCPPETLINWSLDPRGEFDWVVLRTTHLRKPDYRTPQWTKRTQWVYFDRERFETYQKTDGDHHVVLTDQGQHGFARLNKVPVLGLRLPEGLWLMNRAALLQLEHFNKSNALGWALAQGLFAQPVIYSEREWSQMIGDSYFIQLGPQDKFGWTEPAGNVYRIATENLKRLQSEIYRVTYLNHLATAPVVQSGLSKLRDFAITQEVLRALGDSVKDSMKRLLRAIFQARNENITIDVSGMEEFDVADFGTELEDAKNLISMNIPSPTLRKQIFKKLAFKYLCDVRQELKDRIAHEIDHQQMQPHNTKPDKGDSAL
jgi:hypothetical protein